MKSVGDMLVDMALNVLDYKLWESLNLRESCTEDQVKVVNSLSSLGYLDRGEDQVKVVNSLSSLGYLDRGEDQVKVVSSLSSLGYL